MSGDETAFMLLRLAGAPTQAWNAGRHSWFPGHPGGRPVIDHASLAPRKSNLVGLLGAALGRQRAPRDGAALGRRPDADLGDLEQLRYVVRVDLAGWVRTDFVTRPGWTAQGQPITRALSETVLDDAAFLVGVSGDRALIEQAWHALTRPVFELYYGRREYPLALPLRLTLVTDPDADVVATMRQWPWLAPEWARRQLGTKMSLRMYEPRQPRVERATPMGQTSVRIGPAFDLAPQPISNPLGDPEHDEIDWLAALDL